MKITNPNPARALLASINPTNSSNPSDLKWYEIPPGESIEVDDYKVASTLVEHGATADRSELEAARELWAERNRLENSRTASAAASEGEILRRQQATVDVATGGVEGSSTGLKGAALDAAVREANETIERANADDGGNRPKITGSADEKREQLAAWQAGRGSSTDPAETGRFVEVDGELYLDDDGQPVPVEAVEVDENGDPVLVDGKPVPRDENPAD